MALKLITVPAVEPVLITDALLKQSLKVIDTAEDAFISFLLQRGREAAEQITRRALITQSWLMTLDKFPGPGLETSSANWYGPSWGVGPGPLTVTRPDGVTQTEIWVPRCPVQTIDSIKYWDSNNVQQTLDPSSYIADLISEPSRVMPAPGTSWPSTFNRPNAVEVRFTAGYGADGTTVPAGIKHWIILTTNTLYENRELVAILTKGKVEELPYVDGLLTNYCVKTFNAPSYWSAA